MHSVTLISVTIVFAIFALFPGTSGNDRVCSVYEEIKCMGKPLKLDKEFDVNMNKCKEEMRKEKKEDKKDRKRGLSCIELCQYQKSGLLDDKGTPIKDKVEAQLKAMLPAEAFDKIKEKTVECMEKFKDLKNDPKDITCDKHAEFFHCTHKGFASVCDEDFDEVDWD